MAEFAGRFDSVSPVDARYWEADFAQYLSEHGFTTYKLRVELALTKALCARGLCSASVVDEVYRACSARSSSRVTTAEVYDEEDRIRHDIRALVNLIQSRVSDEAKPFVHMTATSFDVSDTANAARYRDCVVNVVVPRLVALERVLIDLAIREAETKQVGRTHGQHASPITFGFAIAGYVSRLGNSIEALRELADRLPGKFSGAVGAYNASALFFDDPENFETEVLAELDLQPAECSTQIVPPEALIRLLSEVVIAIGVMANLSDDMRHLQRTEIGEVGEEFGQSQVGSSTMPQKRNPINFENGKSTWKIVMPRLITVLMDQLSEHQRDLTNSASGRTYGEMLAYAASMAKRLTRTMSKLAVDHGNLKRNLALQGDLVLAEPLYIILASLGHPDAHEQVRQLTLEVQKTRRSLGALLLEKEELVPYWERMTERQRQILADPSLYTGIAAKKARTIAERWRDRLCP